MLIRAVVPGDHAAIWALLEPVFRAGTTYAVDRDISRDAGLAMWCNTPRATFVAEDSGVVLGTYYLKTNHPGGGAHVCNCGYVTAEAARGRGLAAEMCAHSQITARELGYLAMQFNLVLESNAGAVRLWGRLGFDTVGRLPKAFAHPDLGLVDARVMFKWLGADGSAQQNADHDHHQAKSGQA